MFGWSRILKFLMVLFQGERLAIPLIIVAYKIQVLNNASLMCLQFRLNRVLILKMMGIELLGREIRVKYTTIY